MSEHNGEEPVCVCPSAVKRSDKLSLNVEHYGLLRQLSVQDGDDLTEPECADAEDTQSQSPTGMLVLEKMRTKNMYV